jgi:hypothetical protein
MPRLMPEETRDWGVSVVEAMLADGNLWGLALPQPRLRPNVRSEPDAFGRPRVRIEPVTRNAYPLAIRRLWVGVETACRGDDPARVRDAFLHLVVALLRAAHDVDEEEARALLNPRHVELGQIARQFIPVAYGVDADPTRSDGK